jgi:IAA-amino acid hydrolase
MTVQSSAKIDKQELLARAQALHERIRLWRREIHMYPELTFDEHRTSALVQSTLSKLGIENETEVAKTGVVGHIRGGEGPVVGLRADMDALPIHEVNGSPYDSTRPGIMHACGHDAHTAMLLGAATILKDLADEQRLPGTVRLLFQPSEEAQDEEGKSGGMRMVEEGALAGLDAVFGLHVDAYTDVGYVATRPGPLMAAADRFTLVIHGKGGHAARPQSAIDPIALSGVLIGAIQQIVSRRLNPLEAGVITIGSIHGGTVNNVIPDSVTMEGTIRAFTTESQDLLRAELAQTVALVEAMGGRVEYTLYPGYPPTVNATEATAAFEQAAVEVLGAERVIEADMMMGAEDFSYMAQAAPGCFIRLGVHDPAWGDTHYNVHRADFQMDENALPIGAAMLAAAALQWMERNGQ